nr:hypothetical protein [Yersinia enterocolitica]MDA5532323.1 hypothetical protein [Yersinia enterocolitica]
MEKFRSPIQIENLIIHSWSLISLSIPLPIPLKLTIQNADGEKKPSQLVAKPACSQVALSSRNGAG